MNIIEAILLGFIQGITEFLPISSTAHIVIASDLMHLEFPGLTMEIFLHLASVLAVIMYFWKDLIRVIIGFFSYLKNRSEEHIVEYRFGWYIILATMITGVLGYLLQDSISDVIKTPPVIASSLVVTGIFIIFIERFHKYGSKTEATMNWKDSVIVAIGQTIAVIPGISRSGSTLIAALWTGLERETAVRYSFLLVIPVILGSTILMINDIDAALIQEIGIGSLLATFISAFISTVIGIIWLIDFLKKKRLIYFAIYCFLLAAFVFFFLNPTMVMDVD